MVGDGVGWGEGGAIVQESTSKEMQRIRRGSDGLSYEE